jgi:uncharacterized repeat protein (TIGR02543 family)
LFILTKGNKDMKKSKLYLLKFICGLFTILSIASLTKITAQAASRIDEVTSSTGSATYNSNTGSDTNDYYDFTYSITGTGTGLNSANTACITHYYVKNTSGKVSIPESVQVKYNSKTYKLKVTSVGNGSSPVCTDAKSIYTGTYVTVINNYAFANQTNTLSKVGIQGPLTKIGDYAFYRDTFDDFQFSDNDELTYIGRYAFYGNKGTGTSKTVTLGPNANNYSLVIGDYAFAGWSNLTKFTIKMQNSNQKITLGYHSFADTSSLKMFLAIKSDVVPDSYLSYTSVEDVFYNSNLLSEFITNPLSYKTYDTRKWTSISNKYYYNGYHYLATSDKSSDTSAWYYTFTNDTSQKSPRLVNCYLGRYYPTTGSNSDLLRQEWAGTPQTSLAKADEPADNWLPALDGYLPRGTVVTIKLQLARCEHDIKNCEKIKISSAASGKYSFDSVNFSLNAAKGNAWVVCDSTTTKNTSTSETHSATNVQLIEAHTGGSASSGVSALVDVTATYNITTTGYYKFLVSGYGGRCSYGSNSVLFTSMTNEYDPVELPSYTLTVKPNGGTWNSTTSNSSYTMESGTSKTIANPTRSGYTFKGWTVSGASDSSLSGTTFYMGSASTTLTANWQSDSADASYTVYHYKQNIDGTYSSSASDTTTGTATVGSSLTPSVKSYTGFTSPSTKTITIAESGNTVSYYYTRNSYTVTYKDVIDSTSGTVLGSSTASKVYGSTVRGSDKGSSTTDNAYYNGYYYASDTSATVSTSGATVYRIFKLRTIDISGTVKWVDKDNQYGSRPDSVTVYLLKNGSQIDSSSGFTGSNENSFSFTNLPKYDSDGNVIVYTVSQSDVISKNAPEDKYTTEITGDMASGFVITNTLQNNVEETGFTVKGSIIWNDNNNRLGYRPENVIINLYMDGELLKSVTKDKNATDYIFENLERYIYNDDGTVKETHTYQIEEVVNPVPSYVVDGETKEAYTITYSLPKIDTKDGSGIINITNTFNNAEDIIPVKPYNNSLTVKTNKEAYTEIILRKMDADYVDNEVVYKDSYSDVYYNLEINNIAETISHMVAGKYEISTTSPIFTIENVELSDNEYVSLVEEDDKYYVIIEETPHDAYGTVIINLVQKEHEGYQSEISIMNYWKTNVSEKETNVNTKSKVSRKLVVPNNLEENLKNIETESEIEESEINYSEEELENNEII